MNVLVLHLQVTLPCPTSVFQHFGLKWREWHPNTDTFSPLYTPVPCLFLHSYSMSNSLCLSYNTTRWMKSERNLVHRSRLAVAQTHPHPRGCPVTSCAKVTAFSIHSRLPPTQSTHAHTPTHSHIHTFSQSCSADVQNRSEKNRDRAAQSRVCLSEPKPLLSNIANSAGKQRVRRVSAAMFV